MSTPVSPHPFDTAVALVPQGDGVFQGRIPAAYANFIGPFGGVIAANLLNAALLHPQRLGEPLSLTVNFAAPIADAEFTLTARAARTNRSTQHWIIELTQDGGIAATATAVFAARRATWSALEAPIPAAPPFAEVARMPTTGLPKWAKNYDLRMVRGELAMDGIERSNSISTIYVRDWPERPLDFLSLTSINDVFFPRTFIRRQKISIAGTITITIYYHADAEILARQGSAGLLGDARAQRFRNGYFDQIATVWGNEGELLTTTHQMVYFKE